MLIKPPVHAATGPTGEIHPALHDLLAKDETALDTARTLKKWFETRFTFRDRLIEADGLLKVRLLGMSTSEFVLVGEDGWLFYTGEGALDAYRRTRPFTKDELDTWAHTIDTWASLCAKVNARLVVIVAPDKATVYSNAMPAWTKPLAHESRFDQLASLIRARSDVDYVDVRPAFAEARRSGTPLYYRTDTHWNDLAGYIAARELASTLTRRYPAIVLPPFVSSGTVTRLPLGGDLARFLGLKRHLPDEDVRVGLPDAQATVETVWGDHTVPWKRRADLKRDMKIEPHVRSSRPNAPVPRAFVLRDSFGNALVPYLAEYFGTAVYRWTEWLDPQELEDFRPNVVIVEIAERYLMKDPKEFLTKPPPDPAE
jgi:hypothetical protein